MPKIELIHDDCMKVMARYPDNHFDLAICDPPYGIDAGKRRGDTGKNKHIKQNDYKYGDWDKKAPSDEYFIELKRVSKNQIIWGGNYFGLPATSCYLVWDKKNGDNLYADCELAWASFNTAVRKFEYRWHGFLQEKTNKPKEQRIHPTQKPVKLYEWILSNYADKEQRILDTHLGSASSAIASHYFGCDFVGCELDKDYYEAACKRFKAETAQEVLF